MLSHALVYLFVIWLAMSTTLTTAIRVDWNTNKGPIIPPTPSTTIPPRLPYREPAPVWEAQKNDIPNPNPFIYVLPPPSRPRPATNNYLTSDQQAVKKINYNGKNNINFNNNHLDYGNKKNYGKTFSTSDDKKNSYQSGFGSTTNTNSVAALSGGYVPNSVGKYNGAITVPARLQGSGGNQFASLSQSNKKQKSFQFYGRVGNLDSDKTQGKFNAKTKKFKVYEKIKIQNAFEPTNYVRLYNYRYI